MVLHTSATLPAMDRRRAPAVLPPGFVEILRLTAPVLSVLTMERLKILGDLMEDVVRDSQCSMASPTNATQSCQALKRAPAALLLATAAIQRLTVHVPPV